MTAVHEPPTADLRGEPDPAARSNHETLFAELYDAYSRAIFNLVLRSVREWNLAEDVCQEIWVKIDRNLDSLRSPEAITAWVFTIATRTCISAARQRSRRVETGELDDEVPAATPNPELTFLGNEEMRLAWEALGSIKPRQQMALYLREMEGRSYAEIAVMIGASESAIETLLFRARRSLAHKHESLTGSLAARCGQASKVMAVVIDGEANPIQKQALMAHMDGCRTCRSQMQRLRSGSKAYAALPLLEAPKLASMLDAAAAVPIAASSASIFSTIVGLMLPAKMTMAGVAVAGVVGATSLAVPGGLSLNPGDAAVRGLSSSEGSAASELMAPGGGQVSAPRNSGGAGAPEALPPAAPIEPGINAQVELPPVGIVPLEIPPTGVLPVDVGVQINSGGANVSAGVEVGPVGVAAAAGLGVDISPAGIAVDGGVDVSAQTPVGEIGVAADVNADVGPEGIDVDVGAEVIVPPVGDIGVDVGLGQTGPVVDVSIGSGGVVLPPLPPLFP